MTCEPAPSPTSAAPPTRPRSTSAASSSPAVKEGLASEAGTIVHECTHTFARTQDHAYRSDPCKQLALNNPGKALANADSYKFFVEAAFR